MTLETDMLTTVVPSQPEAQLYTEPPANTQPDMLSEASLFVAHLLATLPDTLPDTQPEAQPAAEPPANTQPTNGKNLILYSYSKFSKSQNIKINNFNFFLDKGIIPDKNNIYYFIISGHEIDKNLEDKLKEKKQKTNNIFPDTFHIIKRDNIGYDFGAYSDILFSIDYKIYDYIFCINDSVRGPFLPFWNKNANWINIFTSQFNDTIKLVGPTLNYYRGRPHINSEFFVLDKIGLEICIKTNIFSKNYITNFKQVCQQCELGMSTNILNAGYNIQCLCEAYKNVDFRIYRGGKYATSSLMANIHRRGDPLYTNHYYDRNINIYEVIFIKANRDIDIYLHNKYMEWHLYGNKEYSNL